MTDNKNREKKTLDEGNNLMVEERTEWEDADHLQETLTDVLGALAAFWQAAEPLLRRNASRDGMRALSWNYWQVSDGVKHSIEWLRAMPLRASDGTTVWEPAITNEAPDDSGQAMAPSGSSTGPWDGRTPWEETPQEVRTAPTGSGQGMVEPAVKPAAGQSLAVRETPEDLARHKRAREERKRLAALRSRPRTYPRRRK